MVPLLQPLAPLVATRPQGVALRVSITTVNRTKTRVL